MGVSKKKIMCIMETKTIKHAKNYSPDPAVDFPTLEQSKPKGLLGFGMGLLICLFVAGNSFAQTTVIDFETANDGYTPSTTSGSGVDDVFNRTDNNMFSVSNEDGFYWACEDVAGTPSITLDQINVSAASGFVFSADLLSNKFRLWDNFDHMQVYYSIDGGSDVLLFQVKKVDDGNTSNGIAAVDSDLSGFGDCTDATVLGARTTGTSGSCTVSSSDFKTFSSAVVELDGNSTLDIRIDFQGLSNNGEGIYLDNITIDLDYNSNKTIIDFETAEDGYTTSTTSGSGDTDVFNRTNSDMATVSNEDGFYWAYEDVAGTPSITLDQIDVSDATGFVFNVDLLSNNFNLWDNNDHMQVYYSVDGGSDVLLFQVKKVDDGKTSNGIAAVDSDLSGRGDCTDATVLGARTTGTAGSCTVSSSDFKNFSALPVGLNGNSTLDIRIDFQGLSNNGEGIYLDNITITLDSYSFENGQSGNDFLSLAASSAPRGVAIDAVNNKLYVANTALSTVERYSLPYTDGDAAEVVIAESGSGTHQVDAPYGLTVDPSGNLWIADKNNNRVLRYDNANLVNASSTAADLILGGTQGFAADEMDIPRDVAIDASGNLWVADYGNNRVLRFDNASSLVDGASADGVLGQSGFGTNTTGTSASTMQGPSGVSTYSGALFVADMRNHRVVRFDDASAKSNGADADGVLGQASMMTRVSSTTADGMKTAISCEVDAQGVLWVADNGNNRLVGFKNATLLADGSSADYVLGQSDFVTGAYDTDAGEQAYNLNKASAIAIHPTSGNLYVADTKHDRIVGHVLLAEAATFSTVVPVTLGSYTRVLTVTTTSNSPISEAGFVWSSSNANPTISDNKVVASGVQSAGAMFAVVKNLPANTTINYRAYAINPSGIAYSDAQGLSTGSVLAYDVEDTAVAIFGQSSFNAKVASVGGYGLNSPQDIAVDLVQAKLYIVDQANNRVLRVGTDGVNYTVEAVLGQPDTASTSPATTATGLSSPRGAFVDNNGRLWVTDLGNNRVVWYDNAFALPSGSAANGVLGQDDMTTSASWDRSKYLNKPSKAIVDNDGTLWVADTYNNRVVAYSDAAKRLAGSSPDKVFGQANFTTSASGTTSSTMNRPRGIDLCSDGSLWVADTDNNRVLRFDNASSASNGADADGVLGQANMTSSTSATSSTGMNKPETVAEDPDGTLWVGEVGSKRIVGFASASGLSDGAAADYLVGNPDFNTIKGNPSRNSTGAVSGIFIEPSQFFLVVVDKSNNRLLYFTLKTLGVPREEAPEQLVEQVQGDLMVYPNPSDGHFTLNIPSSSDNVQIAIYDQTGQVVLNKVVGAESHIDLSKMTPGVYFLSASYDGKRGFVKLVVK